MSSKILYNDYYCRQIQNNFLKSFCYNLRLKTIIKLLKINSDDKILEIGANTGEITKELMKLSNHIVGIDVNENAIKIANMPNVILMDAQKLDFKNNFFDKIASIHTIEHIPNIKKTLSEIDRVLKLGGQAAFIYPYEIFRGSSALIDAIKIYGNPIYARKLHVHKLNPRKIEKMIADTNLKIKKSGIFFEPVPAFYTLLEKYKSAN